MDLYTDKFKKHKNNYVNVLDIFARELGMMPAIFLSALIRKHDGLAAAEKDGKTIKFTDDGFFYCTQPDLEQMFPPTDGDLKLPGMTRAYQDKCIKILEARNLITKDTRNRGLEKFRYFKLNEEEIMQMAQKIPTDCSEEADRLSRGSNPNGSGEALSNIYKVIESNNINDKNTSAEAAVCNLGSISQSTLFTLPSLETKKKRKEPRTSEQLKKLGQREQAMVKIEEAQDGIRKWEDVSNRDFTFYYISEHNKRFHKPLTYNQYTDVTAIKNFIAIVEVEREKICELIGAVLDEALADPGTKKFGCLTFNALMNNHVGASYVEQAKRKLYGEIRTIEVNNFDEMRKKHEAKRIGKEPIEQTVHPSDVYF